MNANKIKWIGIVFVLFLAAALDAAVPKYIFLFIGDGMGPNQRNIAEMVSKEAGLGELEMNHFPNQAKTTTFSYNSPVTDSAASGTAIACGAKTYNGVLGMTPDKKNVESVIADAKKAGYRTAVITSVYINHATPAAFYAHVPKRNMYNDIAIQMATSGIDFLGAAGISWKPEKSDVDLYKLYQDNGYTLVFGEEAINKISQPGKYIALMKKTPSSLDYNVDAVDKSRDILTLLELTQAGINALGDKQGFFMMVEGGAIDWAGHSNDIGSNIWETIAMNDAVVAAMDFAKKHPDETLIITTADHETGGMMLKDVDIKKVMKIHVSQGVINSAVTSAKAKGKTFEQTLEILKDLIGLDNITEKEKAKLQKLWDKNILTGRTGLAGRAQQFAAASAGVIWTTGGHTGVQIITTATGPGSELFKGKLDNTDIAKNIRKLLKQASEKK